MLTFGHFGQARPSQLIACSRRLVMLRLTDYRPRLPQSSSSASRFTAGAAGFFIFIQCGERPDRRATIRCAAQFAIYNHDAH